ncbi:hypothetical protein RRF57_002536 [Xylaria bambusicola]|uniref:Uncharacterized protein n=1 Tax=Xylaria bambusicola TaxID=326684 RepID=A0AAN7UIW3_9PEZI
MGGGNSVNYNQTSSPSLYNTFTLTKSARLGKPENYNCEVHGIGRDNRFDRGCNAEDVHENRIEDAVGTVQPGKQSAGHLDGRSYTVVRSFEAVSDTIHSLTHKSALLGMNSPHNSTDV